MKKTLIALAALASVSAFAQVSLTGGLNAQYEKSTAGVTGLNRGDYSMNHLTFTSTEDLGGGLKLTAQFNTRTDSTTGDNTNSGGVRSFQNTTLALSGGFGSLTVGRFQPSSWSGYDAFAGYGDTGYAYNSVVGSRNNSLVQYASPSFSGLTVKVASQVGDTNTNTPSKYTYLRLQYDAGDLSGAYGQEKNANGTTDKNLGLSYDLKAAKVFFINANSNDGAVKNNSVGVNVPMGKATFKAAVQSGDSARQTALGVNYGLSKRTVMYADMIDVEGAASTGYRVGLYTSF